MDLEGILRWNEVNLDQNYDQLEWFWMVFG